ncbi:MAG: aminoacyl-tRNA hydrolase [Blastocatellia bacterium]|nr:aminoacyl-tRNA hydrolase [Blastocatellia bacterium]
MRFRPNGSAGGHNGVKSIIAEIHTNVFPRLRLGIKSSEPIRDLADFVLSVFEKSEVDLVNQMLERAEEAVMFWLKEGNDKTLAFANRDTVS